MKPRTDKQRKIVALSATLPPISQAQERWAISHCFARKASVCKRVAWCSECGGDFDIHAPELSVALGVGSEVVCPHCGATLKCEISRRRKLSEKVYFTIVTTCGGYQVIRHFIASRYTERGDKPFHDFDEAVQNWIDDSGHEEVIARPIKPLQNCYDSWNFSKPMELRDARRQRDYTYKPDKYRIGGTWVYPSRRVLPKVKRNGYTGRNHLLPESEHIKLLLTDREAEMLEKNGQYALLALKYDRGYAEFAMPYAHAVRIAVRNRYRIKDATLWLDYLGLLTYFNLDTHNAHYVCPRNLREAHDRLHRRHEKAEARRRAEERMKEAAKWEEKYRNAKGKFFGICFGDGNITVSVITSVADIAEEGKEMHHCVYSAGYYKRDNCLILSAKDREGRRLETVEVDLGTFKVVQSRAVCNGVSPYHDRILELVNDNIHLIQKASA